MESNCSGLVAMEHRTLFSMPASSIEARSEETLPSRKAVTPSASAWSVAMALWASCSGKACVWKSIIPFIADY